MQRIKWLTILVVWLAAANLVAQAGQQVVDKRDSAPFDAQREKLAFEVLLKIAENLIIPAVDAMPANKFGFAPTDAWR